MKRTDADKAKERALYDSKPGLGEMDDYPYGLCVHLDHDAIEKLGLTDVDMDAADPVMIVAEGIITEDSIRLAGGKKRRSINIQIRKLSLTQEKPQDSAEQVLYGK